MFYFFNNKSIEFKHNYNLKRFFPLSLSLNIVLIINIFLDQITKIFAERKLLVWSSPNDLKSYQGMNYPIWNFAQESVDQTYFLFDIAFNYVRNQGAAWGFLSDAPDIYRIPFFYVVSLIAIGMIINYFKETPVHYRLARFALTMVLSGALGNLIDRIRLGYVIDFIAVRWKIPFGTMLNLDIDWFPSFLSFLNFKIHTDYWLYDFPRFNWADSCITIGVSLLIVHMFFIENQQSNS